MNRLVNSIEPNTFTLSAITIGFILSKDLSPAEQNSIGNWFMMIGQVLCTNASQQQVYNNNDNHIICDDLNNLKNSINTISKELNKL